MSEVRDIFGGVLNDARQSRNGHFWVGVGTAVEHCMTCRLGAPVDEPCQGAPYCECGDHLDCHQFPRGKNECGGGEMREGGCEKQCKQFVRRKRQDL